LTGGSVLNSNRFNVVIGIGLGLLGSATMVHAQTDDIYITDYGSGNLLRYSFTYSDGTISNFTPDGAPDNLSNPAKSAVLIAGSIKEGIQGTHNDIIVVGGQRGDSATVLTRYTLTGNVIGEIPLTKLVGGLWVTYTMNETGNCIITPDGKYMYAPEQGGSVIDKIDLATGHVIGQASFSGVHDVVLSADGTTLYAAAYSSGGGIKAFSTADFVNGGYSGSVTTVIADGNNGLSRPSGLTISGNTLLINQNESGGTANGVYEYTINSDLSLTYKSSVTSSALNFIFGSSIGPDGNLYIAALGDAAGNDSTSYVDGIYEYNTTTGTVNTVAVLPGEPGDASGSSGPYGTGGFYSPKYLEFGIDFAPSSDAGYTPEPGTVALLFASGLVSVAGLRRRRTRRA